MNKRKDITIKIYSSKVKFYYSILYNHLCLKMNIIFFLIHLNQFPQHKQFAKQEIKTFKKKPTIELPAIVIKYIAQSINIVK